MVGYRAAGWTCCGALVLSLLVATVGMGGMGIVGQHKLGLDPTQSKKSSPEAIELAELGLEDAGITSTDVVMGLNEIHQSIGQTQAMGRGQHIGISLSQKLKLFEVV